MESSTGDGGSEASYESVASEGGYEPASERGRDPLPRIISSAHCVEVFRRVRWAEGAFCCHAAPAEDTAVRRGPHKHLRPHDPLGGLPPRLMRFDGAMEAWLEEMPLPRDPQRVPRAYEALNDAAARAAPARAELSTLQAGNRKATLWYFTLEFLQQLWPLFLQPDGTGLKLWEQALLDRGCTIQSTHIKVGQINYPAKTAKERKDWLKNVFAAMQASKWTPDGEARSFLAERRLTHASMSIGDAIQVGSKLFIAGLAGFVPIKESGRLLPPRAEPEDEELLEDEEEEDEEDSEEEVPLPPAAVAIAEAQGRNVGAAGSEKAEDKKGGKGGGRGPKEGKGKAKGQENSEADNGATNRKKDKKRAKEPAPPGAPAAAVGGDGRMDRRKLRAQLQAKREELQGCR